MTLVEILDALTPSVWIVGGVALLVALLRVPNLIRRWLALGRVYGVTPITLQMDVWRYASNGSLRLLQRLGMAGFLVGGAVLLATTSLEATLTSPVAWGCFSLGCGLLYWVSVFEVSIPPTILLLGPSSPELVRLLASLNREFPQYRTVALLRPCRPPLPPGLRLGAWSNNFYTRDLYQWRSIVFHLMDVVPIIILCDADRPAVAEEGRRLEARGYGNRTFATREALLSTASEMQRLYAWLGDRLSSIGDQQTRLARQMELVRMRSSVPAELWYPATVEQFVAKARLLERFALNRYFESCKRGGVASYAGQLLEDIPATTSRAEELQYLRQDRAFEEIELLLRSVREVLGGRGGLDDFNRASVHNKLGLLARFRGIWDEAEQEIGTAIQLLQPLLTGPAADLVAAAFQELGTAYFNLGDVFLARFRETNQVEYRQRAEHYYQLSVDHDLRGGGDVRPAQNRLLALSAGETS